MKTSLAIATAVLMFSAILSLTSGVAAHDYGSLSGKSPGRCGVRPLSNPTAGAHILKPISRPVTAMKMPDWPLPVGRPVGSPSVSNAEVNHRQNELRQSVGDGSLGARAPAPVYRGDWRSPGAALTNIPFLDSQPR